MSSTPNRLKHPHCRKKHYPSSTYLTHVWQPTAGHKAFGPQVENLTEEIDTHCEMSNSAGAGESGGVAGAGQDTEADNEPPQQTLPLLEGDSSEVGDASEEGAPPAAKRLKISREEPLRVQVAEPNKMHGETPAQAGLLLEDLAPPAQSKVPVSMKLHVLN